MMATEKRLIDAIKHRLEGHIAKAINWGIDNIPTGKDSSSSFEFLRGYERGATETANIVLGMIPVDAVEVKRGQWEDVYGGKYANKRFRCSLCKEKALFKFSQDELLSWHEEQKLSNYCPNCGAKMDGDGNG